MNLRLPLNLVSLANALSTGMDGTDAVVAVSVGGTDAGGTDVDVAVLGSTDGVNVSVGIVVGGVIWSDGKVVDVDVVCVNADLDVDAVLSHLSVGLSTSTKSRG